MIETVRVSPAAKDQLITLKRRTGLKHWNELCRWALCRSLAEPSPPSDVPIPAGERGLEIDWKTFAGHRPDLYLDLIRVRCMRDGLDDTPEMVGKQFRLHLHRGIGYLFGDQQVTSTRALLELAVRRSRGAAADG